MTRLKKIRKQAQMCLREIAAKLDITPQTVQQQEQRGIRTVRAARKYAAAFPGTDWRDLIDDEPPACTRAGKL